MKNKKEMTCAELVEKAKREIKSRTDYGTDRVPYRLCQTWLDGNQINLWTYWQGYQINWVYIEPNASGTLEASVVDKADMVYFFTDTLGHGTYFRYLNVVKEHDVKFGYIHGVNIENNIRKMYKDMR